MALGEYIHMFFFSSHLYLLLPIYINGFQEFDYPLCQFTECHGTKMRGQGSYHDMTVSRGTQHQSYVDGGEKKV